MENYPHANKAETKALINNLPIPPKVICISPIAPLISLENRKFK